MAGGFSVPVSTTPLNRQKRLYDVDGTKDRINLMVDHRATLALSRLAIRYGVTKTELLERLILVKQDFELSALSGEEATAYYDSVTA